MTYFLVIDQVFRIFTDFQELHFVKMSYMTLRTWPFPYKKTPFSTLFILSRTSDNTTSQNIGGTNAWAVSPTSNFGGDRPPSPPRFPPLARSSNTRLHDLSK